MAAPCGVQAPRAASIAAFTAGLLACLSCDYGEVVVVQPAAVTRGPLALSIQPDPEDAGVVRELGWTAGIPAAEVTVSPGDADTATGPPIAVLQTDGSGGATVPDLPDGKYLVEVRRLLTATETARLTPGEDVNGFFAKVVVKRGSTIVQAPTSRRHSVVISEWAFNTGWVPGVGTYDFGGFLELANNADTTVYLDGLVIGHGTAPSEDVVPGRCAQFEGWTNDPDGIWTRYFDSLPGTGHTYPLAPGATVVIATDAIDHSAILPGGLDLSHADFEFIGTSDVDNPGVPNTVSVGPEQAFGGHGLYLSRILDAEVFVALPLDAAALPRQRSPDSDDQYARVPRARILDVISLLSTYPFAHPLCPQLVHRNFDRYRGRFITSFLESAHRKVAYTQPDGRKILQHTRTTNADFFVGPRTPGQLP